MTNFGLMTLFVAGGACLLIFLFLSSLSGNNQLPEPVWFGGFTLGLILPVVGWGIAIHAFNDITRPLAELMEAAEVVAGGKLNVRVAEDSPRDFGRLTQTFNRMTGELEKADQQRRNLTADIAHELRTPLHILQGNLEGLLDGIYQPTAQHLSTMLEETRWLARLIEDLHLLSLTESGQLVLKRELIPLEDLLTNLVSGFGGQAKASGINLLLEHHQDLSGLNINGDLERLEQVLGNLLINALQHTLAGGVVTITAEISPTTVKIRVKDSGKGIAEKALPYVFDRFWREEKSRSRDGGAGSGLGLAIARQLVEAHEGQITVESQPGQGATFTILLPL